MIAADAIERARALLELRRPAEAERELRGMLARQPEHPGAHSLLALALSAQGSTAEAIAEASEGVRLAPEHWLTHYLAGQVYCRARLADQAIAALQASLALSPDEASSWELLARAHVLKAQWHQVADAARRGLAIDPQQSGLTSLLALALTMLGEREPARAAAAQAVRLDPENAGAHHVYGTVALAAGDPRRAADAFREVLRLDPGFDQARDLLVTALKQRNPVYRVLDPLRARFRGGWWLLFLLPVAPPVIAVFVLVAVLHWAAWVTESWTTLRLARARATRLLFEGVEARVAVLCCALLVAGAALLGLGIALGSEVVATVGVAVMALITAVQETAHTGSPRGRAILYGWTGLLALAVAAAAPLNSMGTALLSVYAGLATIWVAAGVRRVLPAPA
ncbi:tetratricopeptide repeat protein [Nonomuraea cavernae]|uniref:tetratricopeptide repeat protein n=1 Tax=Nonomuraea cavernae TaxID=2045107 RepID=UPI00166D4722|nr:tetratricopeptide repeat protein [Nonomuraea cavernae]MCA2183653.1 tetratricopeptide repeat protein [Nonomuraea cavernae]